MRSLWCAAGLAVLAWASPLVVLGQGYPVKTVRIIVPFPPGGGSDVLGRIVGQELAEQMKQQVVVDNRAGAGGSIGTEAAVRAAPDGYTLLVGSASEIAINPLVYTRLAYNPVRDLVPIALLATTPILVVVHPSLPVKSVKDLLALARARPGEINMASAGSGTITHLAGALFNSVTGAGLNHVPYKGGAPTASALVSGESQVYFAAQATVIALVKAGRIRAIAVGTAKRTDALPGVPTVIESGVPGYDVAQWYGMLMPAATPKEIVGQLHHEIAQALRKPHATANLAAQGLTPGAYSQPQFAEFIRSEVAKWTKAVKAAGVKLD